MPSNGSQKSPVPYSSHQTLNKNLIALSQTSSKIPSMKLITILWALSISLIFAEDTKFKVGNFTFTATDSWVQAPSSHMVEAAFNHTKKEGPLLKFYHFGASQGGGVKANIDRWKKQFQDHEDETKFKITPEEKTYGDQKLTIVTMTGTYLVGGMMERNKVATPDYMLLGAIIPHPTGDVFLKMTAPEADLKNVKADFEKLIASAFPKAK
jgi:hypothetical protein